MVTKPHWEVVACGSTGSHGIKAISDDQPFVLISEVSRIGHRGQAGWAGIICGWMNEHMRLGFAVNKPLDPVWALKLSKLGDQLRESYEDNAKLRIDNAELRDAIQWAREGLNRYHK